MKKSLGIYIHIPFCLRKCFYCDFCSFSDKDGDYIAAYAAELCRRIAGYAERCSEYSVDTVYFGGGTPSLLPVRLLGGVLDRISECFRLESTAEISLECNPATADIEYFRAVRGFGINRLSIGLQSASDRELALLGRLHTARDFSACFSDARKAGFENISADVMYGIPNQTEHSLENTLSFLCALSPEHISAYGLTVEAGTELERMLPRLNIADDDMQYEMYMLLSDYLRGRGYEKYEISNFAMPSRQSRHNMRYWLGKEYLGFGVAAHSYFDGRRFGNSRDIAAFLNGDDITEEEYALTARDEKNEYVMLGLRLSQGISAEDYARRFGEELFEVYPRLKEWLNSGFMRMQNGRIAFTDKGFFVSNSILSDMLEP